jgi:hypothetical protein
MPHQTSIASLFIQLDPRLSFLDVFIRLVILQVETMYVNHTNNSCLEWQH